MAAINDLQQMAAEMVAHDGERWGKWRYNKGAGVLVYDDSTPSKVEVIVDEITKCSHLVDWLGNVAGKGLERVDAEGLGHLVLALDKIFRLQDFAHRAP